MRRKPQPPAARPPTQQAWTNTTFGRIFCSDAGCGNRLQPRSSRGQSGGDHVQDACDRRVGRVLAAGLIAALPARPLAQTDKRRSQTDKPAAEPRPRRESREAAARSDRRCASGRKNAAPNGKKQKPPARSRRARSLAEILERVQQAPQGGRLKNAELDAICIAACTTRTVKTPRASARLESRRRPLSSSGTGAPRSDRVALHHSMARTGPYDAIFDTA